MVIGSLVVGTGIRMNYLRTCCTHFFQIVVVGCLCSNVFFFWGGGGVIRYTCRKMVCNSKTAGCRSKQSEIREPCEVVIRTWSICDLSVFRIIFDALVSNSKMPGRREKRGEISTYR